ncbi:MAG: hypothetical protein CVV20_02845 [Gemmatimonadetes bacterium HGW-Gemmatimonadetes-1]|nr:MAG: hypothetical protein CVV20_02845 [Gemmatimonadetes bacterium HGW-Gemmatimonadetes-1]
MNSATTSTAHSTAHEPESLLISLWQRHIHQLNWQTLVLIAFTLAATLTIYSNGFVQDDIPIIQTNPAVTGFDVQRIVSESYWPEGYTRDLYRPLASTLLAVQWWVGEGQPVAFRIISVLLACLATLSAWAVARMLLSPSNALGVAALFAVHPVHVETIAVAVNQGELIVAAIIAMTTVLYVKWRRAGVLSWRQRLTVGAAVLIAGLFKEHGIVLPGMLVAAELFLLENRDSLAHRWREFRPVLLLCSLATTMLVLARSMVLDDDLAGTFIAEGLRGQTMAGRALTMLGVVPEWFRLMLWPASLQADYSPMEISAADGWGAAQFLGLGILMLCLLATIRYRRTAPAISFGVLWMAAALFPVSNVLVPTGIVLAERTLYLASIGMMVTVGGMLQLLSPRLGRTRWFLPGLVGLLAILGLSRSLSRYPVWASKESLAVQTVIDAPLSYRARYTLGSMRMEEGDAREGIANFRAALYLWPHRGTLYLHLGDYYWDRGMCVPAIPMFAKGADLILAPQWRAKLVACRMLLGQYDQAKADALQGIREGGSLPVFRRWIFLADSARRTGAPPGSFDLSAGPADSTVNRSTSGAP